MGQARSVHRTALPQMLAPVFTSCVPVAEVVSSPILRRIYLIVTAGPDGSLDLLCRGLYVQHPQGPASLQTYKTNGALVKSKMVTQLTYRDSRTRQAAFLECGCCCGARQGCAQQKVVPK